LLDHRRLLLRRQALDHRAQSAELVWAHLLHGSLRRGEDLLLRHACEHGGIEALERGRVGNAIGAAAKITFSGVFSCAMPRSASSSSTLLKLSPLASADAYMRSIGKATRRSG
jgi:hypothetical protein